MHIAIVIHLGLFEHQRYSANTPTSPLPSHSLPQPQKSRATDFSNIAIVYCFMGNAFSTAFKRSADELTLVLPSTAKEANGCNDEKDHQHECGDRS
jgi:hypothetical protein